VSGTAGQPNGSELPLHSKEALDYREVASLGICAERTLRRLVSLGKVARAVLRAGKRVKFLKSILIEELQARS
jgi:hypothetical protein